MVKALVQWFFSLLGLRLSRLPTKEQQRLIAEADQKKTLWLRNIGIQTVLDIGANTGQFVDHIRSIIPEAMIYSFEPIGKCYKDLVTKYEGMPRFEAFNLALGNQTGQAKIYRNDFSPSSSLLPMAALHKQCFPYTQREKVEKIDVVRLDDIASQLKLCKPLLIKLDVQGFEDKVIAGGLNIFSQADVIFVEMSMEKLYESQPLFEDIYKILSDLGFRYRGNYAQLNNPQDGRILQVDGIFIKF